ncbi:MAG: hypothetical protein GEU80_16810, partial [Dehalococcoidia bacterium]|nr:hypothetical protein [Dehalococcoidia bacterium]
MKFIRTMIGARAAVAAVLGGILAASALFPSVASADGGAGCGDPQQEAAQEQSVDQQANQADVTQKQGNGNVNVSPAISLLGGDARTYNAQGNANEADAKVEQSNEVDQAQIALQEQRVKDGHDASKDRKRHEKAERKDGRSSHDGKAGDGGGQSVAQEQSVGTQANEADVTQKQGNGNVNVSPAISLFGGDARTHNAQ